MKGGDLMASATCKIDNAFAHKLLSKSHELRGCGKNFDPLKTSDDNAYWKHNIISEYS